MSKVDISNVVIMPFATYNQVVKDGRHGAAVGWVCGSVQPPDTPFHLADITNCTILFKELLVIVKKMFSECQGMTTRPPVQM